MRHREIHVFEKPVAQSWFLQKIVHAQVNPPIGHGCYWDEHKLIGQDSQEIIHCPHWEWADLEGKRLVWSTGGKLFAGTLKQNGLCEELLLYDFNKMTFEAIEAPY
jgi:hypothetical protein